MSPETRAALLSALAWQVELGADEAIAEAPQDRFAPASEPRTPAPQPAAPGAAAPPDAPPAPGAAPAAPRVPGGATRPAADARLGAAALAAAAESLEALAEAMRRWDGSPLSETARNFVFSDGRPGAHLMLIGEAPGAEEDRQGKPFVGRAGQLLDRMLAAIGRDRGAEDPARAAYIANILPWRPPGNRTPSEAEAEAFLPFVERHIALARPRVVMTLGNTPTKALLRTANGIKRTRGRWARHAATGLPLMPSFHPAYLLRQPADKRLAWADLIAVQKALEGHDPA